MSSEETPSDNPVDQAPPAPEVQQQAETPGSAAPVVEEQKKPEESDLGKITMREFIDSIEPEFVDARTKRMLDQASGVPLDNSDDDDEQQMMLGAGQGGQEPATVSILRERVQEYYQIREELNSLKIYPKYETLLVKDSNAKREELTGKLARVYGEIVALADSYFNDPAKYQGPTVQHAFVVDPHPEVTVAKILDKIGMPQEPEEPEEFLNPSLIPAKAG